jgi:hypothetical protein
LAAFYIEPTAAAVAEARAGELLVATSCLILVGAAVHAALVARWPLWVAGGLLMPVVLCGGLTLLASQTLLPQLAVVLAYPPALAAGVAGLVLRSRE